jgi:hypothetical protein
MDHPELAYNLLLETTSKLILLRQDAQWRKELPRRCPPILWFGNSNSSQPKIITIGANPSRQEYLRDSSRVAAEKIRVHGDDSQLNFLETPTNRFYVLSASQKLEDILIEKSIQSSILNGYDQYFQNNPYQWFGKNKETSYNVEGFLRGLGATYFSTQHSYQAIHIDLFPFATIHDFNTLHALVAQDLFRGNWAQTIVNLLIDFISPSMIVIFGRSNVAHYTQYIASTLESVSWINHQSASYCFRRDQKRDIPIVGLSTNLGNPKGFSATDLFTFGNRVRDRINLEFSLNPAP